MVLAELGSKITDAMNKMNQKTVVGEEEIKEMLNDIARALLSADVNFAIVKKLQADIKAEVALKSGKEEGGGANRRKVVQTAVFNAINNILEPGQKAFVPKKGQSQVVMFVGLQGSGKTTSCSKYALHFQKKGFKCALICADTFRAGAYDQLKQNASKAKVRFYGSMTESDPVVIAAEGVAELKKEKYDIIIVDTSGRHKQEAHLFEEMKQVETAIKPSDIIYVMSATDGQAIHEQAAQFKAKVSVGSVILTKMDSDAKGGGALSAVAATGSPIAFIGTGEHMDDFDKFDAERFVSKMLGFGDMKGLAEAMKDANIDENSELYKRFQEGAFSMRDMYEHLQNVSKIGPINKIMEMIPGMQGMAGMAGDEGSKAMKGFVQMMDSMNDLELDDAKIKKLLTPSRIRRIARGSGHSVNQVNMLLVTYTRFEDVVKKMGKVNFKAMTKDPSAMLKGGGGGGGGLGGMGGMPNMNDPNMMKQLSKMLDPNMMKQLGGMGGIQNMMKMMGNMK